MRTEPILQFFTFAHLPAHLADVSRGFSTLAENVVANLPRNAERSACLRKLLEAKDAAVRARLFREVMPVAGGPDCPAHDSRCTPERCILEAP